MKKKIVNVLLSVAVVTTMMFTATACGSKDNGSAPAEPAAVTNDEPSSAADDSADDTNADAAGADDNADAAGSMTVDDWINSDEASTYMSLFNTMFGGAMTAEFEADGNTLSMIFTLSEETLGTDGSDLTDEQKEATKALMQEQYDSSKDQFVPMRDELKESIDVSDLVVRIVYRTSNGTELFSQDL